MSTEAVEAPTMNRPTSLLSLPNELIQEIWNHVGRYSRHPICKRLAPFHRAAKFETVFSCPFTFTRLLGFLLNNRSFAPLIRRLDMELTPTLFAKEADTIPFDYVLNLMDVLVNLREFALSGHRPVIDRLIKTPRWIKRFPLLRSIYVCARQDQPESVGGDGDPFNFQNHWSPYTSCPRDWDGGFTVDLRKASYLPLTSTSASTSTSETSLPFELQLFTECDELDFLFPLVSSFSFTLLTFVDFSASNELSKLLSHVRDPRLVTKLSIFSLNPQPYIHLQLPNFTHVTHLTLGGTALPRAPEFYDCLASLPLVFFHVAPQSRLAPRSLLNHLPTMANSPKHLVLDHVFCCLPETWDPQDSSEEEARSTILWELYGPEAELRQLRDVAESLGIEVEGMAIRALEIGVQQFNARNWEEDQYWARVDWTETALKDQLIHDDWCGCHADFDECEMGQVIDGVFEAFAETEGEESEEGEEAQSQDEDFEAESDHHEGA